MGYRYSIIVVCLNAKEKLKNTLESIACQEYRNFEVIVKDGGSTDGTTDCIGEFSDMDIKLIQSKDTGIYDAMNMAIEASSGDFVYFLNTGDYFASSMVLRLLDEKIQSIKVNEQIDNKRQYPLIVYGNIFDRVTSKEIMSNPRIDGFACYRNVPCHQACVYSRELMTEHSFNTEYKVRADYEHFLWCYYKAKAHTYYVDMLIADYEGGGYSAVNEAVSKEEHRKITSMYMTPQELFKYRMILNITLAPLRTKMSQSKLTAGIYNKAKSSLYKLKKK